ncbi:MAG: uncharacterized membrane protein YidH (DUF202 family) [Phenylobacterium sp.]|jgi:uncharacterized membrane protein YidH (DUF202 family)
MWFFKLSQLARTSHLKLSVLMALVFLWLLLMMGLLAQNDAGNFKHSGAIGSALFVSVWIPTAISLVVHVLTRSQSYLDELRPVLACSDAEFSQLKTNVTHEKHTFLIIWGGIGLAVGCTLQWEHLHYLITTDKSLPPFYYLLNVLVLFLWSLMFQVFNTLIRNARLFGQIIQDHLEVNLLDLKRLSPCSKVAIVPVLLAVGLYVVYPLNWVGKPQDYSEMIFPAIFTLPSLLLMFLLPLLPLKRKIQQQKEQQISAITQAINGDKSALKTTYLGGEAHTVTTLEMIQFRQYLEKLNDWGIDSPALKKISVYVLLPPSTWVAAALVEQLVTG